MARSLPAALIADTTRLDGPADDNGKGRGETLRARRPRVRRPIPGGRTSGRKFQVPDSIFDRLQQQAIKKRSNPSAILTELLDRNLPYFDVIVRDRPDTSEE
jgi:hypothetical protein